MIEIKSLTFYNKKDNTFRGRDINITINKSELVILKGDIGFGKTFMMELLLGYPINNKISKVTGNIYLNGEEIIGIKHEKAMKIRRKTGYVESKPDYSVLSKIKVMDLIMNSYDSYEYKNKYPLDIDNLKETFPEISFESDLVGHKNDGHKKLISLLVGCFARPGADLYLIDEPLSGLDDGKRTRIIKKIEEFRKLYPNSTFIISNHESSFTFESSRVIDLNQFI